MTDTPDKQAAEPKQTDGTQTAGEVPAGQPEHGPVNPPPGSGGGGRTGLLVLLLLVALVTVITAVGKSGTRVREVTGEIIYLNLDTREAALEVIDPDTGQGKEYAAEIPEKTEVTIAGEEASLEDLSEGDRVTVRYTVDRRTKEVQKVEVSMP